MDPLSAQSLDAEGELGDELIVVKTKQQPPQGPHEHPRGSGHGERKVTMVTRVDINNQDPGVHTAMAGTAQVSKYLAVGH